MIQADINVIPEVTLESTVDLQLNEFIVPTPTVIIDESPYIYVEPVSGQLIDRLTGVVIQGKSHVLRNDKFVVRMLACGRLRLC